MRQNSQRRSGLYSSRYLQEREKFLVNFNLAINKYCYLISQTERDKKICKEINGLKENLNICVHCLA